MRSSAAIVPAGDTRQLVREVNRLHNDIFAIMLHSIQKAIRVGELLVQLKIRVGHGNWRRWIEGNLKFSHRTARRYLYIFQNREKITNAQSVFQAEKILAEASKIKDWPTAVEADYSRIDRDLIAPVRLVRRRLRKITYIGDSPQTMEMIMENLKEEAQRLLDDLE